MDLERHDPGQQPSIRTSDAERDRVVALLRRHYVDGRLDFDEFDERMDVAHAARTRGDLVTTLRDLPVLATPSPTAATPAAQRPSPPRRHVPMAVPFVMVAMFVGSMLVLSRGFFLIPLLFLWFIAMSGRRWHHGHHGWDHSHRDGIRHL